MSEEQSLSENYRLIANNCYNELDDLKTYINDFVKDGEHSTLHIGYRLGIIACFINDIQDNLKKICYDKDNE